MRSDRATTAYPDCSRSLAARGSSVCSSGRLPLAFRSDRARSQTDANVTAGFQGTVDVRVPAATDPGPVVPMVVRAAPAARTRHGSR